MSHHKRRINIVNIIIFLLIAVSGYLGYTEFNDEFANLFLHGDRIPIQDNIQVEAYFCQSVNCSNILEREIRAADNISCAFYDLDLANIKDALQKKNALLVIDNEMKDELAGFNITYKSDWDAKYMHDKFCIINSKRVITGSMNPTENGAYENDNNLVIVDSSILAANYQAEFDEMFYDNDYHYSKAPQVLEPIIIDKANNIALENYFCPEDACQDHVLTILQEANESIYFMLFSFTSNPIGQLLAEKSNTLHVEGVLESQQNKNSPYSEYLLLNASNASIYLDGNSHFMHHKVFIVDEKTVITGSYNPTNNGNVNNDENVLIIHNRAIAEQFMDEYRRVKTIALHERDK